MTRRSVHAAATVKPVVTDQRTAEIVNAWSTCVTMIATTALAVFAWLQVRHRNQERKERLAKLRAAAVNHALLIRRNLYASLETLEAADSVNNESYKLERWEDHARGMGEVQPRVEQLLELMIEYEGDTGKDIHVVFDTFFKAADEANWLGRTAAICAPEIGRKPHQEAARRQLLLCVTALERIFDLPAL